MVFERFVFQFLTTLPQGITEDLYMLYGLQAFVIIGVFTGTNLGTRLLVRSKAANVRFLFSVFLAGLGIAMAARALGLFGGVL